MRCYYECNDNKHVLTGEQTGRYRWGGIKLSIIDFRGNDENAENKACLLPTAVVMTKMRKIKPVYYQLSC
jgi:hypothetical protein